MDYPKKERIIKIFAESCTIDENEKDEARSYLNSWKKYLLRRLKKDSYNVKIIDEYWGEIPAYLVGALDNRSQLYLKIIIEFEWHYENGGKCEGIPIRY